MTGAVLELGAVVLRWALTAIFAILVKQHVLSPAQGDHFSDAFGEHAAIIVGCVATFAWAVGSRLWARFKLRLALEAPAGTSAAAVRDEAQLTLQGKL